MTRPPRRPVTKLDPHADGGDAALDRALQSLRLDFQPIVWLDRGKLLAYDAVVAYEGHGESHGAGDIEALATLATALGRDREVACRVRALGAAAAAIAPAPFVFLPIGARDLLDPALYDAKASLGRVARRVVLELADHVAAEDITDLDGRIADLRRIGFRLAFDDVNSGPAGLAACAVLGPDFVKLGGSFVRSVQQSPVERRLVHNLCTLLKHFDTCVIAGGVDSAEERQAVADLGCELGQGSLFGAPAPSFQAPAGAAPAPRPAG